MMKFKKGFLALMLLLFVACQANAQSKMRFYFNQPVNTAVSSGVNATYVPNGIADTIISFINKAKYTLDIAQFKYIQSGSYANIATAVNSAYGRGVVVRWIYDGSTTNTGTNALNSNIHTLASPTSSTYGIMHNKFVIIDANSSNATDAYVITGSYDWSSQMFSNEYNNLVVIQDQPLAKAYVAEFNMMWGGTGALPNASASKFGPNKTDLGAHTFTIDGKLVELYFSPSNNTNTHIQAAISSANKDLYFGMYTFTDNSDATLIVSQKNAGVYVAGINDQFSHSYSPYTTFTNGLGSNFKEYTGSSIYHNKYLVVDPSDKCSDPQVLTGSHNWTISANTKNDENTLIIHSDTAANIYYQAFSGDFAALGGTLTLQHGCSTAVKPIVVPEYHISIYPNPTAETAHFSYELPFAQSVSFYVIDATGRIVAGEKDALNENEGRHAKTIDLPAPGIYFWMFQSGDYKANGKVVRL